jgi:hypothetical protein
MKMSTNAIHLWMLEEDIRAHVRHHACKGYDCPTRLAMQYKCTKTLLPLVLVEEALADLPE